jgi:hypothetical protein
VTASLADRLARLAIDFANRLPLFDPGATYLSSGLGQGAIGVPHRLAPYTADLRAPSLPFDA